LVSLSSAAQGAASNWAHALDLAASARLKLGLVTEMVAITPPQLVRFPLI